MTALGESSAGLTSRKKTGSLGDQWRRRASDAPVRRRARRVVVDHVAMQRSVGARDLPVVAIEWRLSADRSDQRRFASRTCTTRGRSARAADSIELWARGRPAGPRSARARASGLWSRVRSTDTRYRRVAVAPPSETQYARDDVRRARLFPPSDLGPRALVEPLRRSDRHRSVRTHVVDLHHHLDALLGRSLALANECVVELSDQTERDGRLRTC